MLDFTYSTTEDYAAFGRQLWLEKDGFRTHEDASQAVVEHLFQEFITEEGEPQLALARIFRFTSTADLPPDVRALVGADEKRVMALTGTWGIEEAWQHRSRSQGHQAIPISLIAIPEKIPMFQAVLTQLGIDLEQFYQTGELDLTSVRLAQGTFYIPDARSREIPAQEQFVKPYGVRSLVGLGGLVGDPEGVALYLLYAFSRVPISQEAAQAFYGIQEFVGATIGTPDKIFNG